jgi:hypothetical protein
MLDVCDERWSLLKLKKTHPLITVEYNKIASNNLYHDGLHTVSQIQNHQVMLEIISPPNYARHHISTTGTHVWNRSTHAAIPPALWKQRRSMAAVRAEWRVISSAGLSHFAHLSHGHGGHVPVYVAGMYRAGDRKSVQPMAERLALPARPSAPFRLVGRLDAACSKRSSWPRLTRSWVGVTRTS